MQLFQTLLQLLQLFKTHLIDPNPTSNDDSFPFGYLRINGFSPELLVAELLHSAVVQLVHALRRAQEDNEGSWSVGVFYGDSPFSLKPIEAVSFFFCFCFWVGSIWVFFMIKKGKYLDFGIWGFVGFF